MILSKPNGEKSKSRHLTESEKATNFHLFDFLLLSKSLNVAILKKLWQGGGKTDSC